MKKRGALNQRVGAHVREIRQGRKSSQEAFARELDYDRTYLGGLERGERNLTLDTLEELATRLEVDPLDLVAPVQPSDSEPKSSSSES